MRIPPVIDLESINRDEFTVSERQTPAGLLWLVCPKKNKMKWSPGEEHLRSLLCRADGRVVSSGFPKFCNYGERPDLDALTDEAIASGRCTFTEKLDGSLIIRSVIDGVVAWRTRGSHEMGIFTDRVMAIVRERHPALLSPLVADGALGMLFEFSCPTNVIVLRYGESTLTLLGAVGADGLVYAAAEMPRLGVPSVASRDLPSTTAEARAAVASWNDAEGVVAWCRLPDGGHHLAKMKSARYIAMHAFKSHITEAKVWAYCHARGIESAAGLALAFEADALDWEMVEPARPWVETYVARVAEVERDAGFIRAEMAKVADADRKTKALAAKSACEANGRMDLFGWAIAEATGDARASDSLAAVTLGMTANEYRAKRATFAALSIGDAPDE